MSSQAGEVLRIEPMCTAPCAHALCIKFASGVHCSFAERCTPKQTDIVTLLCAVNLMLPEG